MVVTASADEHSRTKVPSHEYEQCANPCQKVLNEASSKCLRTYGDKVAGKLVSCVAVADAKYEKCIKMCPVDTGRRRSIRKTDQA